MEPPEVRVGDENDNCSLDGVKRLLNKLISSKDISKYQSRLYSSNKSIVSCNMVDFLEETDKEFKDWFSTFRRQMEWKNYMLESKTSIYSNSMKISTENIIKLISTENVIKSIKRQRPSIRQDKTIYSDGHINLLIKESNFLASVTHLVQLRLKFLSFLCF